jgi:hypothetical protein
MRQETRASATQCRNHSIYSGAPSFYPLDFGYGAEGNGESTVCVETGYGQDDCGVGFRALLGPRIFSSHRPDRL